MDQFTRTQRLEVTLPYELLLAKQAVILGQHQQGRTILALREIPSCDISLVEQLAVSQGGRQLTLLRQLAAATNMFKKALCVEYVAAAEDGHGRLYARQVSAQSLSRDARCLLYGQSHKEIDMSGAHYEILRRSIGAPTLPDIALLREIITGDCQGSGEDFDAFFKLLPIRLLNSGADRALSHARERGYYPSDRVISLFREIETLRNIHLPSVLATRRPTLAVSFRIRNYHACETIESQFMHCFYCNLCMRTQVTTAIWLHDGMWVSRDVPNEVIRLAEREALVSVFPGFQLDDPVFRIVPLESRYNDLRERLNGLGPGPPLLPEVPRKFAHVLTTQHPKPVFHQKGVEQHAQINQDQYLERVSKRPRL